MDERVIKFRVGVMVLSMPIIAGILLLLFGDARSLVRGSYTVNIHFSDAPGVTEGTPVRKSGILIGRVSHVEFAPQGGVLVKAKIDGNVKLYRNEVPQVSGSLLGGDVVIQFVRRSRASAVEPAGDATPATPPRASPTAASEVRTAAADGGEAAPASPSDAPSVPTDPNQEVQPGEYIEGSVAPNAFQVISNLEGELSTAIGSLSTAGTEVGKVASSLNRLLGDNDEKINRIVDKTEVALDSFQKALNSVDTLIGDDELRTNLKKTLEDMPQLMSDTRGAVNSIRTTVESMDRNLQNLEGLTGPLGERGDSIVTSVDQAVTRLDDLLGEFSDFGRKLNRGEGSLGQLMRNPELYQNLNNAARNIEHLTRELKPILANLKVFSDKIARHPESLGVKGVIQRNPGIK